MPQIDNKLKALQEFLTTIDVNSKKTAKSLDLLNSTIDAIANADIVPARIQDISKAFTTVSTSAMATTKEIRQASQALEYLIRNYERFWNGRKSSTGQLVQMSEASRIAAGERFANATAGMVSNWQNPNYDITKLLAAEREIKRTIRQISGSTGADLSILLYDALYTDITKTFGKEEFTSTVRRTRLPQFLTPAETQEQLEKLWRITPQKTDLSGFEELADALQGGGLIGQPVIEPIMASLNRMQSNRNLAVEIRNKLQGINTSGFGSFREALSEMEILGKQAPLEPDIFSAINRVDVSRNVNNLRAIEAELQKYISSMEQATRKATEANLNLPIDKLQSNIRARVAYRTGPREKEVPLQQLLNTNLQEEFATLEEFIGSYNGGPKAAERLKHYVNTYGYDFTNLRHVQREASTGITSLQFGKTVNIGGKDFFESMSVTLDKFGQVLNDTQKRFRSFTSAVGRDIVEFTKWSIAAAVVYAPLQKASEIVEGMINAQSSLADLQIVTSQSTQEAAKSFDLFATIARQTGEDLTDTIEAYKLAYTAAGSISNEYKRAATASILLKDALTLSKLSGLSEASSMDILSAGLKQLGMDLTEGSVLIDKWVATQKVAAVNMETLATSFAILSSAAEDAGMSIDEMNGVIAAASEVSNLSARETGNMIRAFISGFQSDTAIKELGKFGIAVRDDENNVRGFLTVLNELKYMTSTEAGFIQPGQQSKIMDILGGGARRGAQYSAFMENLGRVQAVAAASAAANGEGYTALETKTKTLETANKNLTTSFAMLAKTLGYEGGVLESTTKMVNVFSGLVDVLTTLTSLLGKAAIPTALSAISLAVMGNPGIANRSNEIAKQFGYNLGYGFTTLGANREQFQLNTTQGIRANWSNMLMRLFGLGGISPADTLASKAFGNRRGEELTGYELAGDRIGRRFSNFLSQKTEWVLPSAILFTSAITQALGGDWAASIGGLAGAGIGIAASKALTGKASPIGMLIGQAIAEAFVNASRQNPDIRGGLVTSIVGGLKAPQEEPETEINKLKLERETRLKELEEAITKAGGGGWLQNTFTNTVGYLGAQIFGYKGTKDQYAYDLLKAKATGEGGMMAGWQPFVNKEENKRLFDEYEKLVKDYIAMEAKLPDLSAKSLSGDNISPFIKQAKETFDLYDKIMKESFIPFQKKEFQTQLQYGQLTPTQFNENIKSLQAFESYMAMVFTAAGKGFNDMANDIETADEAYKAMAKTIINLSPQERDQIVALVGTINTLAAAGKPTADVEKQLSTIIYGAYRAQKFQNIVLPTKVGNTAYTEEQANIIYQYAVQARDLFYEQFVPDQEIREKMINDLEEIAVRVGQVSGETAGVEYWKAFENVGSDFWAEGTQLAKKSGKLKTEDFQIYPMMDVTQETFKNQIIPLTRFYEELMRNAGWQVDQEQFGVILKENVTDDLVANLLAFRLAQEKTNELLQKQLDGIYNLPEGAEFWVPWQAALMGAETLSAKNKSGELPTTTQTYKPYNAKDTWEVTGRLSGAESNPIPSYNAPDVWEITKRFSGANVMSVEERLEELRLEREKYERLNNDRSTLDLEIEPVHPSLSTRVEQINPQLTLTINLQQNQNLQLNGKLLWEAIKMYLWQDTLFFGGSKALSYTQSIQ